MNLNLKPSIEPVVEQTQLQTIKLHELLAAVIVSLVMTIATFNIFPLSSENPVLVYIQMAKDPYRFHGMPYGGRFLTPLIAHYLPLDYDQGFRFIAFMSYWGTGVLLFLIMRLMKASMWMAFALLPAFYFASTSRYIAAHTWFNDPIAYLSLSAIFLGLLTGNLGASMGSWVISVFNRPVSLLLSPIVLIAWFKKKNICGSLVSIVVSVLPAAIIVFVIWKIWPMLSSFKILEQIMGAPTKTTNEDLWAVFEQHGVAILLSSKIYREMLPFLWGPAAVGFLVLKPRLILLALSQIFLSAAPMMVAVDFFRLPFYAFPAFFILAGAGIAELAKINIALALVAIGICWGHLAADPFAMWPGMTSGLVFLGIVIALRVKKAKKIHR